MQQKLLIQDSKKYIDSIQKTHGKALADVIALHDEKIPESNYTIFDPNNTWQQKTLVNYTVKPLQEQIFKSGKLIYSSPSLTEIYKHCKEELNTLWDEVKRLDNPHKYYVDLSHDLWNLKNTLLN